MNKQNPLVKWITRRVLKKNKNCIIVINGSTGSGKTYAAINMAQTLAEESGTPFNIQDNMDFEFSKLLMKTRMNTNDKPGTVFLFEEVGATGGGASSREWQSKANVFFNSFMQTARHRNQIFIMTCPLFSSLEKGTRSLAHLQITMQKIDYANKISYGKPFIIQTNPVSGKMYMKYLRFSVNGTKTKLKQLLFELPPPDIAAMYEKNKKAFTDKLNDKIIKAGEEKKKHPYNKVDYDKDKFKESLKIKITDKERGNMFGVSDRTIRNWKTELNSGSFSNKMSHFPKENGFLKE